MRTPCLTCGNAMPERSLHAPGPKPRYCSSLCKSRANDAAKRQDGRYAAGLRSAAERRASNRENRAPLVCRGCGEEMPIDVARNRKFCGAGCAEAYRAQALDRCTAPGCDKPVRARGLCHPHWRREARAEGREANPEWDERRRANWNKRMQVVRAGEAIDRFAIFDRDSWVCGICAEPVDPALAWPHPRSVSIDHIVPLALGGEHSEGNVQCSHLVCNEIKGVSMLKGTA